MRNTKTIGIALLVLGIIVLIASAGADIVGLGAYKTFGWKQIVGALIGIGLAAAGFVLYSRKSGV
jgi:hypothetical protein